MEGRRPLRRSSPRPTPTALTRDAFDEVLDLVGDGIETGRGPGPPTSTTTGSTASCGGRKGARLAALTSGGAIPELGDFRVIAEPDETLIGSVNEDWATESMAGDVFILGTHHWQIRQVTRRGAGGRRRRQAPDDPVLARRGAGPHRGAERGGAGIRSVVERGVVDDDPDGAVDEIVELAGVERDAAATIVTYLAAGGPCSASCPPRTTWSSSGSSTSRAGCSSWSTRPTAAGVNRALGLRAAQEVLRRVQLRAPGRANDDAIVISLGPHHSFPLADVPRFLSRTVDGHAAAGHPRPADLPEPLAVEPQPSLVVLRFRGGRRKPPPIQRMQSDDLLAAVFPRPPPARRTSPGRSRCPTTRSRARRCTTASPRRSTATGSSSCRRVEEGEVRFHFVDSTEPSLLAHEILTARPYAFLDDGEVETGAPTPSRCAGAWPSISARSGAVTRRRSTGCAPRSSRRPPRPTSSTTS